MDPWFSEQYAGLVGGLAGAGIGTIFGGIGGPLAGVLVPRGKGKPVVLGMFWTGLVLGIAMLTAGVIARVIGQPWYVAFSIGLSGLVLTPLMAVLLPLVYRGYRMAEERALAAEEIRRG